ncbi:MAG: His/Gly/Thr/Pro-type tRNA ligase C-terminal domain-containing protein, partial [Candidatus Altiarchaeota archaeon]
AAVMAVHGDEKGLVLPPKISPVQVVIIPVVFKEAQREKIIEALKKDVENLKKKGFRVAFDDGDDRPGAKYYRWEKKGVPLRIEVGPKEVEAGIRTLARRDTGEKIQVRADGLEKEIISLFKSIEENLRNKAQERFDSNLYIAKDLKQLRKLVGKGIVTAGWCQTDECAKPIDELGTILSMNDEPNKCVICGADHAKTIKVAKTY